mmetsp:Transcript_22874/g.29878  ORF Transcript_22874/g.29878 Transcript_22874/m.29878 type:complete len:168 (-) Transcript_22874:46-549(-)
MRFYFFEEENESGHQEVSKDALPELKISDEVLGMNNAGCDDWFKKNPPAFEQTDFDSSLMIANSVSFESRVPMQFYQQPIDIHQSIPEFISLQGKEEKEVIEIKHFFNMVIDTARCWNELSHENKLPLSSPYLDYFISDFCLGSKKNELQDDFVKQIQQHGWKYVEC